MGALFMKEGKYSRIPLTQTLMGNEMKKAVQVAVVIVLVFLTIIQQEELL